MMNMVTKLEFLLLKLVWRMYMKLSKIQTVWRYIPFMNWSLVVKIDADEVFAKVYVFEELFWFLIAITLLIGIAVAFIIAKCIAGPICKLQRGAEIIGGGNLDFRVGIETRDEIGQLACSFAYMVANLKKQG